MSLTPEQKELGRRNFLRVLAGTPALAALGTSAVLKGPVRGGPVRLGIVGLGGEGRNALLKNVDPAFGEVRAVCDIHPGQLAKADEILAAAKRPPATHYADWKEMLQKEDLEAVILAPPLWLHADMTVGCLEAGKHVLCEKMMAWDAEGCRRMQTAAKKTGYLLEIGYQRFYNPVYQAAYEGILKAGLLGDLYHARLVWHRNGTWRRQAEPPSPDYDPSRWGYPTFDHLVNWRLFWRYSKGLLAELASHQVNISNWFFGSSPMAVTGAGGVYRFPEGQREVPDHVFATFEYPQGRTATFSSIESNAFDDYYEMFMGTKGTLVLSRETEAYLFQEGADAGATAVQVAPKGGGPALEASETRPTSTGGQWKAAPGDLVERGSSYRNEISEFCAAVRVGRPLRCGPDKAVGSALACLAAHEAIEKKTRVVLA
jgi:predicted dehydrogenase